MLTDELLNGLQIREDARPKEWPALTLAMLRKMLSEVMSEANAERIRQTVVAVNT